MKRMLVLVFVIILGMMVTACSTACIVGTRGSGPDAKPVQYPQ